VAEEPERDDGQGRTATSSPVAWAAGHDSPQGGDNALCGDHTDEVMDAQSASLVRRWWQSRLGYRFLPDSPHIFSLFFCTKLIRFPVRGQASEAYDNALRVIDFERTLRFFTEPDLQRLVLHHPEVVRALNRYYVMAHFPITIAALAWLYVRRPLAYLTARRVLVITTALGLVIHMLYPLAPPRMLPGFGFVDTGHVFGPAAYGAGAVFNGLANQFAAMPSLHFGWAVVVAITIIRQARTRLRWLIVLHPVATTAAIVMTANHYWMDVIVAAVLVALVYAMLPFISAHLPWRNRTRWRDTSTSKGGRTAGRAPASAALADGGVVIDLVAIEHRADGAGPGAVDIAHGEARSRLDDRPAGAPPP
jgi:hypothetical protein